MPLNYSGFFHHNTYDRFKKIFKIINIVKLILIFPIIIIIILIRPIFKIKFGQIDTKTIGNCVSPIEIIFYEKKENLHGTNKEVYVWFTLNIISNKFWLNKIKSKMVVLPRILISPIFTFFQYFNFGKNFLIPMRKADAEKDPHKIRNIYDLSPSCDINEVLLKNPPVINFDKNEIYKGNLFLLKHKILEEDKIICIHTRSAAYRNEKKNSTRNSSIENFAKTIDFFTNKGFKVIRMGRDEQKAYNISNKNFFDYSACREQNDFLDFFIISKCSFFIGAASGLVHVAQIFRKPIMYHNMFHLPDMIHFDGNYEKIILPKKIFDKNSQEFFKYKDTFSKNYIKPVSNNNELSDIEIIENTEDEIFFASKEMYDLIIEKKDLKIDQKVFFDLFEKFYYNPLVKKTMISNKFYLDNFDLFQ